MVVVVVMGRGGKLLTTAKGRSLQKPLDINTCKNLWILEGSVPSSLTLRCLLHQVVWKHLGSGWGRRQYRRFALGPTRYLSGARKGDSSCRGVTETKAKCHKVTAGCDRYPRDPLLNQVSSSLPVCVGGQELYLTLTAPPSVRIRSWHKTGTQ